MATTDIVGGVEYEFGAQVRLSITVKQSGSLLDPSGEITIIIEEPDGTETTEIYDNGNGNVQRSDVGAYYYDWTISKVGIHEYRWKTASPIGVRESYFVALASRVANP